MLLGELLRVVGGIEGADGALVHQERGEIDGHGELRLAGGLQLFGLLGVISAHEDAAGKVPACRDTIDPRDGVLQVLRFAREGEEFIQAGELDGILFDFARDDRAKLHLGPGDEAGETHAADGRFIERLILRCGALVFLSIGADQLEARHVAAEGAGDVVVLAVDVIGDGAADGDKFCARGDGQEPAPGDGEVQYLGQGDAGLAAQQAVGRIEGDEAVQTRAQPAAFRLRAGRNRRRSGPCRRAAWAPAGGADNGKSLVQ